MEELPPMKTKKKTDLVKPNGKVYTYDDISHLNETQKAHRRGEVDVYEGDPSIADLWRFNANFSHR